MPEAVGSAVGCLLQFRGKVGASMQISQSKGAWQFYLTWGQLMSAGVGSSCLESSLSDFNINLKGSVILENYKDFSVIFPTLGNLLIAFWLLRHDWVL